MRITGRAGTAYKQLPLLRGILPIAVSLCVLWILRDKIMNVDLGGMVQTAFQFSTRDWTIAAFLTAVSFYAVAQYDRLVAAQMELSIPRRTILAAGWRATAIGQVLGYGLVTGSLTRWRALGRIDGLSLWECSRMTAGVTVSFFAGWVVVASTAITLAPQEQFQGLPRQLAIIGLLLTLIAIIASVRPPSKWARQVPPLRFIIPVIGFTAVDTIAAAAVLFVFLPEGYVPFFVLYAAFLVALTAGMASGLPGGLGAFELCLLTLLAPPEPAPLLAAILAFRMIYYAAPAIIAGVTLIKAPKAVETSSEAPTVLPALPLSLVQYAPPEADLSVQNLLSFKLQNRQTAALWHRARNCDVVLGDPFGSGDNAEFLAALRQESKATGRGLAIYKCSAKTRVASAMIGIKIGSEAVVNPIKYDVLGATRRQLRRKLRKADKANISISETVDNYAALEDIDREWRLQNGPARGFSMGYLSPNLIARQRVFVARKDNDIVAFVTFLIGAEKWTLDVMRSKRDCPDGAIHKAVCTAIEAAKAESVVELSLAAAPGHLDHPPASLAERIVNTIYERNAHLKGLAQFKASFGPEWQPRYLVASSLPTMGFALFDLWHLVQHVHPTPSINVSEVNNHYGFYEFDSPKEACHALQRMTSKDESHDFEHRNEFQCLNRTPR